MEKYFNLNQYLIYQSCHWGIETLYKMLIQVKGQFKNAKIIYQEMTHTIMTLQWNANSWILPALSPNSIYPELSVLHFILMLRDKNLNIGIRKPSFDVGNWNGFVGDVAVKKWNLKRLHAFVSAVKINFNLTASKYQL